VFAKKKAFCTPPNANDINFDSLYVELSHRTCLFNKYNPDPDTILYTA